MIKTESKRPCAICDEGKEFFDIDYLRTKPSQMKLCSKCGFIFSDKFYNEEEYEIYYETTYRMNTVNSTHLITANRKIGYLEKTLGEYLKKEKDLKICDLGAGIGYVLKWARDQHKHTQIFGTELDLHMRRYAKNAFDIALAREFDDTKEYDLIFFNHVLEHVINPLAELKRIKKTLTKRGILYVSIPLWMDGIAFINNNQRADFDNYFAENHINCWTKKQIEFLFMKAGFKIEKEFDLHGHIYILRPEISDKIFSQQISKNAHEVEIELLDMKRAIEAYKKNNFREAIRLYPNFTDAYLAESAFNQGKFDLQMKILQSAMKTCKNNSIVKINIGLLLYQYGKIDEAHKVFLEALEIYPHDENIMFHVAMIHFQKGENFYKEGKDEDGKKNWSEALQIFQIILNINPLRYGEIYNFIGHIFSKKIFNGEEIQEKFPKFNAPGGDGAPKIELEMQ